MSDILEIWLIGCAVAFIVGSVFGGVVIALQRRRGWVNHDALKQVCRSGVGAVCLWVPGYPLAVLVILALRYVFGGA